MKILPLLILLSFLMYLNACKKESFEFTPTELNGKFIANQTADFLSISCVANPDASFGQSLLVKYVSDEQIQLFSTTYIWNQNTGKSEEIPTVFKVNIVNHYNHFDFTYKGKIVGDYRIDKIYEGKLSNKKYKRGKILNIRLEDTELSQFLMFRGSKE